MTSVILTVVLHYEEAQFRPFAVSLARTGYQGKLVVFGNLPMGWECLKGLDIDRRPFTCPADFHIGNVRHREYWLYLRDLAQVPDQVILADARDVIWQTDPAKNMPSAGLHSFEEHRAMTIGSCPYNGPAIDGFFGPAAMRRLADKPIICAGMIAGGGNEVGHYAFRLWDRLFKGPRSAHGVVLTDQAHHEMSFYELEPTATIWHNELGPVYTVGYIPRESLTLDADGLLHNQAGIPCAIHQYDRHENLKAAFLEKYR
jgi:hypothetical protein